jgi:hypothetical protein
VVLVEVDKLLQQALQTLAVEVAVTVDQVVQE